VYDYPLLFESDVKYLQSIITLLVASILHATVLSNTGLSEL